MADVCVKCGGTFHVQRVSPDMDIQPVALCMQCLIGMVARAREPECTCPCLDGREKDEK